MPQTELIAMKKIYFPLIIVALICMSAGNSGKDYTGFTDSQAQLQRNWESKYDSLLNADEIGGFIKFLSAHPHNLGTIHDRENADFILSKFIMCV